MLMIPALNVNAAMKRLVLGKQWATKRMKALLLPAHWFAGTRGQPCTQADHSPGLGR
jgi:hypothetical protein